MGLGSDWVRIPGPLLLLLGPSLGPLPCLPSPLPESPQSVTCGAGWLTMNSWKVRCPTLVCEGI